MRTGRPRTRSEDVIWKPQETRAMAPKLRQVWKENGSRTRFVRILDVTEYPHGARSVLMETVRCHDGRWINTSYSVSWINATRFNGEADGFSLHEDVT